MNDNFLLLAIQNISTERQNSVEAKLNPLRVYILFALVKFYRFDELALLSEY